MDCSALLALASVHGLVWMTSATRRSVVCFSDECPRIIPGERTIHVAVAMYSWGLSWSKMLLGVFAAEMYGDS